MSKVITKQVLNKVFWRGIFMQFSWNYERMQTLGYCWTILPVLKKIYKDDSQGLKSAVTRNLEFFNTSSLYGNAVRVFPWLWKKLLLMVKK